MATNAQNLFNINQFRANLLGDGARPNLFSISMVFPGIVPDGAAAGDKTQFMAKAAQLPGSTVGTVSQYYFGRQLKFPGNRTFADWTITVINDEDFLIRAAMEEWMNSINSNESNLRNPNAVNALGYTTEAHVYQYGKTGDVIYEYDFVGMFPTDIAPIDLDWGTNDSIEEYSITFAYQYWTVSGVTT